MHLPTGKNKRVRLKLIESNDNSMEEVKDDENRKLPRLPESELKEKINSLRQKLDKKEREIKNTFREISLYNKGGEDLRSKRDGLNARVKEISLKASELRNKRDEVNKKIADLKSERDNLRNTGKESGGKIGELKKNRDDLNKTARGRLETLGKAYEEELNTLKTADIPLEYEIKVFNRLLELGSRLDATKKANVIHDEISQEYDRVKDVYREMDSVHENIQALAEESQKYHEDMMALYGEMDVIRKEADSYHSQLSEKYKCIAPLRKKIDVLKSDKEKTRIDLEIYLEQMKDVQLVKEEKKNETKRVEAKDKLQKSGRLSLDEFRILVENDDIKL